MVNNDKCIIKVLKPVAAKKINREIKILRNLTGGPNVVALLDVVRDRSARYHSLIMEFIENVEWKSLFPKLTEADIKYYTFQLLKVDPPRTFQHCVVLINPQKGFGLCTFPWDYASRREARECDDRSSSPRGMLPLFIIEPVELTGRFP